MVNSERQLVRDALRALQNVFDGLEGFSLREKPEGGAGDKGYDAILLASSAEVVLEIVINVRSMRGTSLILVTKTGQRVMALHACKSGTRHGSGRKRTLL